MQRHGMSNSCPMVVHFLPYALYTRGDIFIQVVMTCLQDVRVVATFPSPLIPLSATCQWFRWHSARTTSTSIHQSIAYSGQFLVVQTMSTISLITQLRILPLLKQSLEVLKLDSAWNIQPFLESYLHVLCSLFGLLVFDLDSEILSVLGIAFDKRAIQMYWHFPHLDVWLTMPHICSKKRKLYGRKIDVLYLCKLSKFQKVITFVSWCPKHPFVRIIVSDKTHTATLIANVCFHPRCNNCRARCP